MKHLRTYQLAVQFHKSCKNTQLKGAIKDQLMRASVSITLNLSEGSGKRTLPDQKRFFQIAFGSIRECQAIIDLYPEAFSSEEVNTLDHAAAGIYKLLRWEP